VVCFCPGISVIFEAEELQESSPTASVNQQLSNEFANLGVRSAAVSASPLPLQQVGLVSPTVGSQTTAIVGTVQQSSAINLPGPPQPGRTVSPAAHLVHNQSLAASSTQFASQPQITNSNAGLFSIFHLTLWIC
jgi:hypothetical protein